MTVAFSESTMNSRQVQLWYNRFKEDQEDVDVDTRPSGSSEQTLKQWRE